jgi:hypothetical protein
MSTHTASPFVQVALLSLLLGFAGSASAESRSSSGVSEHAETIQAHRSRVASTTSIDDGLDGMAWGSDPIDGMMMFHIEGDTSHYALQEGASQAGDVALEAIEYTYWQGQFFRAVAKMTGRAKCRKLLNELTDTYGQAAPVDGRQSWEGEEATVSYLGYSPKVCFVVFSNNELAMAEDTSQEHEG